MTLSSLLLVVGGSIYVALGALHALWSLADVQRPRRFVPGDREVQDAMRRSTVRVTSGRTTMWDAWLGFNISHGLGAAVFGSVAIVTGLLRGGEFATPVLMLVVLGVSLIYLVLAVRFWFYLPVAGIGVATACFAGALVLVASGG